MLALFQAPLLALHCCWRVSLSGSLLALLSGCCLQKPEEEEEPGQLTASACFKPTLQSSGSSKPLLPPSSCKVLARTRTAQSTLDQAARENRHRAHPTFHTRKTWPPRPPIQCICFSGMSTMPAFSGSWRTCAGSRV